MDHLFVPLFFAFIIYTSNEALRKCNIRYLWNFDPTNYQKSMAVSVNEGTYPGRRKIEIKQIQPPFRVVQHMEKSGRSPGQH